MITSHPLPVDGDEAATLLGALDRNRRTFAWKCTGVDADGARATVGVSTMTLGGLLKHLALVEDHHLSQELTGSPACAPFDSVDFEADPDWEWRTAADDDPAALVELWESCVARSQANVARALAATGLAGPVPHRVAGDGTPFSLRRVLVDLVEEYARHTGHADLIRESVDGLVGEGDPGGGVSP